MSRSIDFDKEEVIRSAMEVFWDKGYENTSMKDLIEATGLLKGSLYNSFGSKEKLFMACLKMYGNQSKKNYFSTQEDPKSYLKNFFKRLVNEGKNKKFTKGCLIMNSCLEFSNGRDNMADLSMSFFNATEDNFKKVVIAIKGENSSSLDVDTTRLITAAFSIREISKFRKDEAFLKQIANTALKEFGVSI